MILSIENLHVYYGSIHALKGINLEVNKGEIVTLIGANGAGKTTTMGAISGLLPIKDGKITFKDKVISGMPAEKIKPLGISLSPEGRGIFPELSVEDNLRLGAYLIRDKQYLSNHYDYIYSLFPRLKERYRQQAGTLSGGEQQRVSIARALAKNPKLLLCDEPTGALDYQTGKAILKLLQDMCRERGMTVIVITHNSALTPMADRVIKIKNGKVSRMTMNDHPTPIEEIEW